MQYVTITEDLPAVFINPAAVSNPGMAVSRGSLVMRPVAPVTTAKTPLAIRCHLALRSSVATTFSGVIASDEPACGPASNCNLVMGR